MPFIKVHISSIEIPAKKPLLAKMLREIMIEKLQIDENIGQVALYEALPQNRSVHYTRSKNFVFIEVIMYPGRTAEMKVSLMQALVEAVSNILDIKLEGINCCIMEIPADNWYGGIGHDYINELKTRNE